MFMYNEACCFPYTMNIQPCSHYDNPYYFYSTLGMGALHNVGRYSSLHWNWRVLPHAGGPEVIGARPPHTRHVDLATQHPDGVVLQGPTAKKRVSLTFDDGPDDVWTPNILDVLSQNSVKATFTCIGQRVKQNPEILQRIANEGHSIMNGSWDHPNFTQIDSSEIKAQIGRTSKVIYDITNVRTRFFRPPYGDLTNKEVVQINQLGYQIVFWNVDSMDWAQFTTYQVAANVLAHTKPGSIIAMHCALGDGGSLSNTVSALPTIIKGLKENGYSFKTIDQLLAPTTKDTLERK